MLGTIMAALKQMSGEEFVREVLGGERDFSGIALEAGFDLSGYDGFNEMQAYLKEQNLSRNPVIITGSKFYRVKARDLYLPYAKGRKAVLREADLGGADLVGAVLERADLERAVLAGAFLPGADLKRADLERAVLAGAVLVGADLKRANLERAVLEGADLREAVLRGAVLRGAVLEGAVLRRADLRGVRKLEYSVNLGSASYGGTIVTPEEKSVIEKALNGRALFGRALFDVRIDAGV